MELLLGYTLQGRIHILVAAVVFINDALLFTKDLAAALCTGAEIAVLALRGNFFAEILFLCHGLIPFPSAFIYLYIIAHFPAYFNQFPL